jgi:hypothetical protein
VHEQDGVKRKEREREREREKESERERENLCDPTDEGELRDYGRPGNYFAHVSPLDLHFPALLTSARTHTHLTFLSVSHSLSCSLARVRALSLSLSMYQQGQLHQPVALEDLLEQLLGLVICCEALRRSD